MPRHHRRISLRTNIPSPVDQGVDARIGVSTAEHIPVADHWGDDLDRHDFGYWVVRASFAIFGATAFILTSAVWAELPILYRKAPEGPRLGAYLALCTQAAGLLPLGYMHSKLAVREPQGLVATVYALMMGGFWVAIFLALLTPRTTKVAGGHHSLDLYLLAFLSACISNTANTVYLPFGRRYYGSMTKALYAGQAMGGVLAALGSLAQDSGGDPRVSVRIFFGAVACLFILGLTGFTFILQGGTAYLVPYWDTGTIFTPHSSFDYEEIPGILGQLEEVKESNTPTSQAGSITATSERHRPPEAWWHRHPVAAVLAQQMLSAALCQGLAPAISPIFVRGCRSPSAVLMWCIAGGMCAGPGGQLLARTVGDRGIWLATSIGIGCGAALMVLAWVDPAAHRLWGMNTGMPVVVVALYVVLQLCGGFVLTAGGLRLHSLVSELHLDKPSQWGRTSVQAGVLAGVVTGFVLVVILDVFGTR